MNSKIRTTILLAFLPFALSIGAAAQTPEYSISSTEFRVVDGDTVDVAEMRVRLTGIDALEKNQSCRNAKGASWACGRAAADMLKGMLESAPEGVKCVITGKDRYGNNLGSCSIGNGTIDVQKALVQAGLAVAEYANTYVADEQMAREQKRGMWSGESIRPKYWRRGERLSQN